MAQGDGPILACQRQAMDYFLTHLDEWLLRAVRGLLRCASQCLLTRKLTLKSSNLAAEKCPQPPILVIASRAKQSPVSGIDHRMCCNM